MDIFDEKIDELLAKHLAGENSPEEENTVAQWLKESPDHRKYFDDLKWLWTHSIDGKAAAPRPVDTDAALERVKRQVRQNSSRRGRTVQLRVWMRAAAVFLLLATAVYWWQNSRKVPTFDIAALDTALRDTLVDGSVVRLEPRSGVSLAAGFNRRERRLRLQGEAFFEVAHDTTRPFFVDVLDMQVRVVGTAFTVDNMTDAAKVVVTVTEGKVLVSVKNQSLLLTPGEQAEYDSRTALLRRTSPAQGQPKAPERLLRFQATPLSTVAQQIKSVYGVEVTFKNKSLEDCLLTAYYNDLPIDRLMSIIAETFSIRVEKTTGGYVLDGESCGE